MSMNKLWIVMMLVGLVVLAVRNPSALLGEMVGAAEGAAQITFGLLGVYAVWLGILEVLSASGLARSAAKGLRPVIRALFGQEVLPLAAERIALNFSANLLGVGSAATPMGLAAMQALDTGEEVASHAQILLIVINATSIQLIPTTLIGIRAGAGATHPADIILPSLIATVTTTAVGIALCKLCKAVCERKRRVRRGHQ